MEPKLDKRVISIMRAREFKPMCLDKSDRRELVISKVLGEKFKLKHNIFFGCKNNSNECKERLFVFEYFFKMGKSESDIHNIWKLYRTRDHRLSEPYKKKPLRERKDNMHPELNGINYGGGGSNYSKIRVPSKKRKNKLKNFRKLFPEYCEKFNI